MEWKPFRLIYDAGITDGALIGICDPSIAPITPIQIIEIYDDKQIIKCNISY